LSSIDTHIPSTQQPNTSIPVAITDAYGVLFHQQLTNQLRDDDFGGAGEEGLREVVAMGVAVCGGAVGS
jgi:hypothetical protein